MKTTLVVAITLIVIGIVAFAFQGITYTTKEPVDIGPIHLTTEKTHKIPLLPIVGGVVLASGIVLLVIDRKKS